MRQRRRGAVLLEGAFALVPLVSAVLLSVEWARRGWIDVALMSSACGIARDVRWGLGRQTAFERARPVLQAALGESGASVLQRQSHLMVERRRQAVRAKLYLRAPLLWRFELGEQSRHHLEVTQKCLSP